MPLGTLATAVAVKTFNNVPKSNPSIATKLRGSAAGIRLGNLLFSANNSSLNPTQVTQAMRAILAGLGYQLPAQIIIPLDAAQVIMAGGAFVSAVDTALDIKSIAMPSALALKAISTLGRDLGIMDEQSSEIINFGADAAMVIASGGYNVLADIALVIDIISDIGNFQNKVTADGYRNFGDYFNRIMSPQKIAAASSVSRYQKGDINIFECMAEIATTSPNIFLNYFPEMQGFIPEYLQTISYHTEETSWWGDHRSYDVSKQIIAVANGHDVVEQAILEKFVLDPLKPFYDAQVLGPKKISIHAITLLILGLNQSAKTIINDIGIGWSALPLLRKFRVTPYVLGDEFLFQGVFDGMQASQSPIPYSSDKIQVPAEDNTGGFSLNGNQIFTSQQSQNKSIRKYDIALEQQMLDLDRNGDIEGLLKIPLAVAILQDYCQPDLSQVRNTAITRNPDGGLQQITVANPSLKIQDYWQGVNLFDIIKKTPFFEAGTVDLEQYNYLGDLEDLHNKMHHFQNFWLAKSLNMLAYQNIARYLGTNADNITLRHYNENGTGTFKVGK